MAISDVREYIRQRRLPGIRGLDPESIHGVNFDSEVDTMVELTVSDLEELLAIADGSHYKKVAEHFHVAALEDGALEVYANRPIQIQAQAANIVHLRTVSIDTTPTNK